MAILSLTQSYSIQIDGQTYTGGSTTAATITAAGETIFDRTYSATSGIQTEVFQAGSGVNDDLADWVFMFFQSDVAGELRFTVNKAGSTLGQDQHGFVIALAASIPFMMTGGDASRYDPSSTELVDDKTANPFAGTASVIDFIDFNQVSGGAGKLRVVAIR